MYIANQIHSFFLLITQFRFYLYEMSHFVFMNLSHLVIDDFFREENIEFLPVETFHNLNKECLNFAEEISFLNEILLK